MSDSSRWTAFEPPVPAIGAVLLTCVPYRGLNDAVVRPHPAIVVKRYSFLSGHFVLVIGGTSIYDDRGVRKRDWADEIDLDEAQRKHANLPKPTKFGLNRNSIRLLPFTDQFFIPNAAQRPSGYGQISLKDGAFWNAVVAGGYDVLLQQVSAELIAAYVAEANAPS